MYLIIKDLHRTEHNYLMATILYFPSKIYLLQNQLLFCLQSSQRAFGKGNSARSELLRGRLSRLLSQKGW